MYIGSPVRIVSAGASFLLEREISGIEGVAIVQRKFSNPLSRTSFRTSVKAPSVGSSTAAIKVYTWEMRYLDGIVRYLDGIKPEKKKRSKKYRRRLIRRVFEKRKKAVIARFWFSP